MKEYDIRIREKEAELKIVFAELELLKEQKEKTEKLDGIKKWIDYPFESSSGPTNEWVAFCKDFKKYIKNNLPKNAELVGWLNGHFEVAGFIKKNNKYVYFSCLDVRFFPNEWYNNLLIRTAKDEKDFKGGSNGYTSLKNFKENIEKYLNY